MLYEDEEGSGGLMINHTTLVNYHIVKTWFLHTHLAMNIFK